jgi:hypothetical protein
MTENNDSRCLICRTESGLVDAHSTIKTYHDLYHVEIMPEWLKIIDKFVSSELLPKFLKRIEQGTVQSVDLEINSKYPFERRFSL